MIRSIGGFAACLVLFVGPAFGDCSPTSVDLRGPWGQARFNIEIADDARSRATGLMHREDLPMSSGMLFVYESAVPVSFWMRNTLIKLDILFADAQGVIRKIHHNAQPHSEVLIPSEGPALAVLEINGGLAKALDVTEGSEMRHMAFDQATAAWACAEK